MATDNLAGSRDPSGLRLGVERELPFFEGLIVKGDFSRDRLPRAGVYVFPSTARASQCQATHQKMQPTDRMNLIKTCPIMRFSRWRDQVD